MRGFLKNLALALSNLEMYEEAERHYREAVAVDRGIDGNDQRLANSLTSLADLLATLGRFDEAEPAASEAVEIRRTTDPEHPRMAGSLLVLGRIRLGLGLPEQAEPLLAESVERYTQQVAQDDRRLLRARRELEACRAALALQAEQASQ